MTTRFTEAEKGKKQVSETRGNPVKRIKAPSLDNSVLIKDNALTLIGRITNPREQKIWALIPALPRKWNLRGRGEGSDLGNNCFQFRFEREDDLKRVLDNSPYHFAYWMIFLQRWEPVISASFPSMIPFWIRIKGLPLHFWHDDMVTRVGQDLGMFISHELTRTTARVRVLIDGMKPLVKEAIVEFDSGEESLITLEYEKLEMHCFSCFSLFHSSRDCPQYLEEEPDKTIASVTRATKEYVEPRRERTSHSPSRTNQKNLPKELAGAKQSPPRPRPTTSRVVEYDGRLEASFPAFKERLDRHGNAFGERVSTKQTRNPPPAEISAKEIAPPAQQRREPTPQNALRLNMSPPYTKSREQSGRPSQRGKDLFPRRSEGQWRPKITAEVDEAGSERHELSQRAREPTVLVQPQKETQIDRPKTAEEIMEELQEVTRQYQNCADPVEAAARRQRVIRSDELGLMEATAASILASSQAQQVRQTRLTLRDDTDSNPNTPPPLQNASDRPRRDNFPSAMLTPRIAEDEDFGLEPLFYEGPHVEALATSAAVDRPAKLKSIIVSPPNHALEVQETPQSTPGAPTDDETLLEYQKKLKRKASKATKPNKESSTPNVLRGVSFKKRKLSQIQNSPRYSSSTEKLVSKSHKVRRKSTAEAGPSHAPVNPPINLIPAMTRSKSDFRLPLHQVP